MSGTARRVNKHIQRIEQSGKIDMEYEYGDRVVMDVDSLMSDPDPVVKITVDYASGRRLICRTME